LRALNRNPCLSQKKNNQQVYYVAKRMDKPCTIEEYAVALARYLVTKYPRVSRAKVSVEQAPWKRHQNASSSQPHDHCYVSSGSEIRTVKVVAEKNGTVEVVSGLKELRVLKTTQSGYTGFLRDSHTALGETTDRMMATSVTANWRYTPSSVQGPAGAFDYDRAYEAVRSGLLDAAFGPPKGGVYSPSVQYTLYEMAGLALRRCPSAESVFLNMPNLHFIPAKIEGPPPHNSFDNDVFVATSEPHGNIEAVVTRKQLSGGGGGGAAPPHVSKL
jgi:urate oxidase